MLSPIVEVLCLVLVLFCKSVLSRFVIISPRKRELVDLLELYSCYHVAVNVKCLFLAVPWVGLQFVIAHFLVILNCWNQLSQSVKYHEKQRSCAPIPGFAQA